MKKKFMLSLFLSLAIMSMLSACSNSSKNEKTKESNEPISSESTDMKEEIITSTPLISEPKTVLDSYEFDIDGDGLEETIELLTGAERGDDGDIMWDDGQEWKLTVKKEDSEFVLFDERIQIGMLNHQVFEVDGKLHIAYTLNATAQLAFVHFEYEPSKNVFIKKNEYINNEENINVLHHTMNTFDK